MKFLERLDGKFKDSHKFISMKFVFCSNKDISNFKNKNELLVQQTQNLLELSFPKNKGSIDNIHILNSIIFTMLEGNQLSYFLTNDYLNCGLNININNYFIRVSEKIKSELSINLELKHFPEFVKSLK